MTCSFSYKGISKEDCVNLCNDETNNLCTTYCSNKCNNCQDQSKCAWLLNTTVSPPKSTTPPKKLYNSSKMNDLVDRVVQYSGVSDMLLDDESQMGDELKKLEKIKDDAQKRDIIYNYLMEMYTVNTKLLNKNFKENKQISEDLDGKQDKIKEDRETIKIQQSTLKAKEREFKINLGKYNKIVFETQTIKFVMFMTLLLFIIPLLYLGNILPKIVAVIIYLILVGCILGLGIYRIKREEQRRDTIFYQKYNFEKPTRENVLKSYLDQKLDPKCKSDLNTDEDDFNPNNIDIGSVSSWKNGIPGK